jgi:phosphoribosylanthranilate isomerase
MLVKVCGNNDLESINQLEKISTIDFLGFIFYSKSKRNLTIDLPKTKVKKRVGVFVNEEVQIIKDKIQEFDLDYIQLHGDESVELCESINKIKAVIKVFHIDMNFDFNSVEVYLSSCSYFLFDTKTEIYGGSGQKFPWQKLAEYPFSKEYFLSGGISFSDSEVLKNMPKECVGIDINSKFELEIGKKNYTLIDEFLKK